MSYTVRAVLIGIAISLMLIGCSNRQKFERHQLAPEKRDEVVKDRPAELHKYYVDLEEEGERNAVLNYMRIGRKAYEHNHVSEAEEAFDKAIFGIEQVYGYDQKAADVRSLWIEEGAKSFKGEPYERAMAFFYRGLLYLEKDDYDNARASFKSGQLQDAFAEEEQHRCDFALLMFMEGWCSFMSGDTTLADQSFSETAALRPEFALPMTDNVLVLVETGSAPRKVGDGPGHSELKFRRGKGFTEQTVQVSLNGGPARKLFSMESIYWQAASRGGRAVDKIIGGKAEFRSTAAQAGNVIADIGNTAVVISPLLNSSSNLGAIGGAVGLVGVTSMAVAQSSRPHADTRYWDSLPDAYHVLTTHLEPGLYEMKFEFLDENGDILSDKTIVQSVRKVAGQGVFVWIPSPSV